MSRKSATGPLVRKGASFPFQIAAVAWVDLLGYGAMISEAGFNPMHPKAHAAIRRIRAFHEQVASSSKRAFPTLVMNDGAVAYRDLSIRSHSVTQEFIVNAWNLFSAIRESELAAGYPGPRMVIAAGFRMRGRRAGMDQTAGHFGDLMLRFREKRIGAEEAIREASRMTRSFDVIPQLQANFAFTKAYVAESSGKAAGLGGSHCYIDLAFLNAPFPQWLGEPVLWKNAGLKMEATFAPLTNAPKWQHAKNSPRDALQVAQHLVGDEDVLGALQKAPRQSSREGL